MGRVNERGAGRKKALDDEIIEKYRNRFQNGETVLSLAEEAGVSRQTMSAYVHTNDIENQIYFRYHLWAKLNREFRNQNLHHYSLRIEFMNEQRCCSVILVDFAHENVLVLNKTDNPVLRPFGMKAKPSWDDLIYFLEERCIPENRFQMKQILRDLKLDRYDLIRILEKTEGRTGEDEMWIKFAYLEAESGKL